MIIIKKKNILAFLLFTCILVFSLLLGTTTTDEIVQTVALPVTNKVIVIDAGHGFPDNRSRK